MNNPLNDTQRLNANHISRNVLFELSLNTNRICSQMIAHLLQNVLGESVSRLDEEEVVDSVGEVQRRFGDANVDQEL
jgi:hypothetical protein